MVIGRDELVRISLSQVSGTVGTIGIALQNGVTKRLAEHSTRALQR